MSAILYLSGPLNFRLVIKVLLGPRMILNACACRPDLGLTSHPNNVVLLLEQYTHIQPAQCPGRDSNPELYGWEAITLPLRYFPYLRGMIGDCCIIIMIIYWFEMYGLGVKRAGSSWTITGEIAGGVAGASRC